MIGILSVILSLSIFIYTTLWFITPLLEENCSFRNLFPDYSVLIYGPPILLIIGLVAVFGLLKLKLK